MKDRAITLLGALLALAIVYALFFPRQAAPPASEPLSIDAGRNGYLGLRNWLAGQDVRVESLRERYRALLDADGFAGGGNVLVVTMPFRTALRTSEAAAFQSWIARGNTVLILAALDDTPDWLPLTGDELMRDLAMLTGFRFTPSRAETDAGEDGDRAGGDVSPFAALRPPVDAQTPIELVPAGAHPLLEGVESLRGFSDGPSELWRGRHADDYRLALTLAYEESSGLDALWQLPRGAGQIVLAASGSLLANRNIGEGGARHLVANLVRRHVAPGAAVIFDDMHQGLSSQYDASAFLRDERLRHTIWFVLAAWLIYIVGSSNRLSPPRAPRPAPRAGELIAAAGGLMARRLDKSAAGLLLFEEWLDQVRRARGLAHGAPVWLELEATPTLARGVYEKLRAFHRRLADGGTVDLVELHNALRQAREAIG